MNDKINSILKISGMQWLSYFQDALREISEKKMIPSKIFLTVDQDFAPFFKNLFKQEEFHRYALANDSFNVTILKQGDFNDFVSLNNKSQRDESLMIKTIFINKMNQI